MTDGLVRAGDLKPSSKSDLEAAFAVRRFIEEKLASVEIPTDQFLHAGCYSRTCLVKAGVVAAGAVIKIPTIVIVSGKCLVLVGDEVHSIDGYAVLRGAPGRCQTFRAISDTYITMIFSTASTTCDDAEKEFTDEWERLQTRRQQCQE